MAQNLPGMRPDELAERFGAPPQFQPDGNLTYEGEVFLGEQEFPQKDGRILKGLVALVNEFGLEIRWAVFSAIPREEARARAAAEKVRRLIDESPERVARWAARAQLAAKTRQREGEVLALLEEYRGRMKSPEAIRLLMEKSDHSPPGLFYAWTVRAEEAEAVEWTGILRRLQKLLEFLAGQEA